MADIDEALRNLEAENLDEGFVRTRDHKEIQTWVEKYQGKPQWFDDPEAKADKPGIRIDFPGKQDKKYMQEAVKLNTIGWDNFFKLFEMAKLDFIYKENPDEGEDLSQCYMFVRRDR